MTQPHDSFESRALERIPVTGVDQPWRRRKSTGGRWINGRIDLGILPRFRMTVGEHADSQAVTHHGDTLIFLAGTRRNLRCCWPPTGKTINESGTCGRGIGVRVTYKKSISRPQNASSLEPLRRRESDSAHCESLVRLRVEPQKVSVVTIADQVPIKCPVPR